MPTEFDPGLDPTRNRLGDTGPATARGGNGGLIAGVVVVLLIIVGVFALRGNFGTMEGRSVSAAPSTTSAPADTTMSATPTAPAPAPATPAPAAPAANP